MCLSVIERSCRNAAGRLKKRAAVRPVTGTEAQLSQQLCIIMAESASARGYLAIESVVCEQYRRATNQVEIGHGMKRSS